MTFNGTAVQSVYADPDTLQLMVPPITTGPVQVTLKNPSGETCSDL